MSEARHNIHAVPRSAVSNREFMEMYARPGMVALAGGDTFIDRMIALAERHVDEHKAWGRWTHAFVIGERRCDGRLWVLESDLDVHGKHIRLGALENRLDKYDDEKLYTSLALLDFGLPPETAGRVLAGGLDLVAARARYSLRELAGTLIALRHPQMRPKANPLARPESYYCSAFVRCLFLKAGVDLTPGLEIKNTTPEDIWRSPLACEAWLLAGAAPESRIAGAVEGVRRKIRLKRLLAQRRKAAGDKQKTEG